MKNYYYVYMYRVIVDHTAVLFSTRLCFASRLKISLVLVKPNPAMSNTADGPITYVMFILSVFSVKTYLRKFA